ncbi:hypothetical protein CR194_16000 [Salipaludibacillus keqinensis]|uniref:TraB/GumN family protein n=1 Tax=Salipaludibacillus keqinensis TaxID=2045207 RepID=A0A323TSE3_9BACI|nr:TraB/GumN family protein [Salipaludibacillus keqinensis]PYZ92335.1 hypothetical protein CR194_16000 [Salipaludibacillus keqinensis]
MLRKTIILGSLLIFTACSAKVSHDEGYFQGEELERIVNEELGKDSEEITEEDLARIETLDASGAEIKTINGIESLSSLEQVNLSGNDIDDYSPLQSLEQLSEINVGDLYFTEDMEPNQWKALEELEDEGIEIHARTRLSFDEHEGPSEGVFYRVQEGDQTIYLFGSVHVGDEGLYPLQEEIDEAFQQADYLAVEVDINEIDEMEAQQIMMQQAMYTDGTSLSDVIEEDVFQETVNQLSGMGVNEMMVDQFKPWFVSMMLSEVALANTEYTGDDGIDLHFLDRAAKKDLPIISLESLESQIESMSSAPEENQVEALEDMVNSLDIYEEELTQLIRLWQSGNVDVFAQLREMDSDIEQLDMDERDLAMTEKIEGFLSEDDGGTYFVVVGALHLAGEGSIVDLLDDRGYTVESVDDF